MSNKTLSELEILEFFRKELGLTHPHPMNLAGNTDDAAVMPLLPKDFSTYATGKRTRLGDRADSLVFTQDAMIENIHFRLDYSTPEQIVAKCMTVNVSDLAAMGASPLGALVHVGLPKPYAVREFLASLTRGLRRSMQRYSFTVFGGDLTAARDFTISAALIGRIDHRRMMLRSGANAGDVLCISGTLGLASLGLKLLEARRKGRISVAELRRFPRSTKRLLAPRARLALGLKMAEAGLVTSCIDLSDSLARSLRLLAEQSHVGFSIELSSRLLHREVRKYYGHLDSRRLADITFSAEEDFELLFTIGASDAEKAHRLLPRGVIPIGTALAHENGILAFHRGKRIAFKNGGFEHFGKRHSR